MQVDVWSDVMCPWCAIGRARLNTAIEGFRSSHGEDVQVHWRSFELDPNAPERVDGDYVMLLAKKYGQTRENAQQMVDQMASRGAEEGVAFDFSRIRPGNTFDAHRLLHLAHEHGLQDTLKERLFRAYFSEGAAVGERDVLEALAVEVGLDAAAVRQVLDSDAYGPAVRGDESLARQLGVNGVPFFVIDQRIGVSGAQPAEVLQGALAHAIDTREPEPQPVDDAEGCGPEGCAV